MSGLAGLLAGRHAAGVYRWHAGFDVADVRHTVEHAGWGFACVDGWTHQDKAGFLTEVGKALAFPEWYGENFDALVDCLRDVSGPEGAGTVLLWDGWGPFAREDRHAFDVAVDVLAGRAVEQPAFVTLLRGDGPELDVASLDG
ncbi:barstar family protein [Nocardioides terrisoli]|uniref:barstar family protein n=1 Tax=Nocardioides terrisoli TaxID=3388267 RepID=UPI00287B7427|nr:barstar family protein [Nocardioides marmorisolisilvae]